MVYKSVDLFFTITDNFFTKKHQQQKKQPALCDISVVYWFKEQTTLSMGLPAW